VKCPNCDEGDLVERRTRKGGRLFWGCNKFPKCKTATWNKPVAIDEKTGKLQVEDKEGNTVFQEDMVKKKPAAKKTAKKAPKKAVKKKPVKKKTAKKKGVKKS